MPSKQLKTALKRDSLITKFDKELRSQDLSKNTIKNYKFHVGQFLDDQGVDIKKVTQKDLLRYYRKLAKGHSVEFVRQAFASINRFCVKVVDKPSLKNLHLQVLEEINH